jgi:hypothetical protein
MQAIQLAELRPAGDVELSPARGVPLSVDRLSALLAPAQPILRNFVTLHGNKYLMVFSAKTLHAFGHGEAVLMRAKGGGIRAIATTANGSIVENAVLVQGLSGAEKAFVIWETAAAVTLQKYLSDIMKSLRKIEAGLGDVLGRLDDEVDGKLRVNGDTVSRMAQELQGGSFPSHEVTAYMVQLDNIERESARIAKSCLLLAQGTLSDLTGLRDQPGNWKDREERAIELLTAGSRAQHRAVLGLVVSGAAAHLRAFVSASPGMLRERLDARVADAKALREHRTAFQEVCRTRVQEIEGTLSMGKTDSVYRARFQFASELYLREVGFAHEALDGYISELASGLENAAALGQS